MDYSCPSPGRCRRTALAARMHLTDASRFDFEVEAKPSRIPVREGGSDCLLFCCALPFGGGAPFTVFEARTWLLSGTTNLSGSCRPCYGSRTGSALVQAPAQPPEHPAPSPAPPPPPPPPPPVGELRRALGPIWLAYIVRFLRPSEP